jgi:invasion protein IalB
MSIKSLIISGAAVLALTMGATIAEAKTAPKAPKDPAAVTQKAETSKVHSETSIACSKQADEKKLHGKARKAFRKTCMKAA